MTESRIRIYLVRHPPVAVKKSYCYGREDVAAAEPFHTWQEHLIKHIPHWQDLSLLSSPLQRCRRPIEALRDRAVEIDEDLAEMSFGDWEGQYWPELPRAELDHWNVDFHHHAPPGGETGAELQARCARIFDRIAAAGRDHLLITHGGWIRAALAHALDTTMNLTARLRIDYGGISRITRYTSWSRVDHVNR